jgi:uncharacterized protein (TIGR02246 family)
MTDIQDAAVGIYTALLEAWNRQDAPAFAALFAPGATVTGFDGSQMNGPAEIAAELGRIFTGHRTAAYVAKVREVRALAPTVTLQRAIAGMIPPGGSALNPAVNAIQSVILVSDGTPGMPRIAHFQNTPAAFHGRPDLQHAMTSELAAVYESGRVV